MLTRKILVFLLVFITLSGITLPKPSELEKKCPTQPIEKEKLDINVMPMNFRNSYDNQRNKQMLMQLSVTKKVKQCMDDNKFNLTITLDESGAGYDDEMKVSSTATQHLITIGEKAIEIESCKDSDHDNKESEKYLKHLLSWTSQDKSNRRLQKEIIFFTAPFNLWAIEQMRISSITMMFDEPNKKKNCEYDTKKKFPIQIKNPKEIGDSISGLLMFSLPNVEENDQTEVYMMKDQLGPRLGNRSKHRFSVR